MAMAFPWGVSRREAETPEGAGAGEGLAGFCVMSLHLWVLSPDGGKCQGREKADFRGAARKPHASSQVHSRGKVQRGIRTPRGQAVHGE